MAFQTSALHKAFIGMTKGKEEEKWLNLSTHTQEHARTIMSHNFDSLNGIPRWYDYSFVSKKDLKVIHFSLSLDLLM